MPIVLMNSSTGMPLRTCTFLKTSSAVCGRCARSGNLTTKRHKKHKRIFCVFCAFLWLISSLLFIDLLPGRVHRLAHKKRRVRSRAGLELLDPPVVHFGDIEVAFLIDAEAVDSPEPAGKIARSEERRVGKECRW